VPQPGKHGAGVKPASRSDVYGDPLPPGTLARVGTVRDYIGEGSSRITLTPFRDQFSPCGPIGARA
jgi:hypothetical protein